MTTVKEAARIVGLSEYALRQGIKQGRYPHIRTGLGAGKILLNISLLEQYIEQEMRDSVREQPKPLEIVNYGGLRRIAE